MHDLQRQDSRRQTLHLSIDSSPYARSAPRPPPGDQRNSRSTLASIYTTATHGSSLYTDPGADCRLFSVICLFDFFTDDPDQLPFRKNDILDVVKTEDDGWWAALPVQGGDVGWIPSSFVKDLTDEQAEYLVNVSHGIRLNELHAELLYTNAPTSTLDHLFGADSPTDQEQQYGQPSQLPTAQAMQGGMSNGMYARRPSVPDLYPQQSKDPITQTSMVSPSPRLPAPISQPYPQSQPPPPSTPGFSNKPMPPTPKGDNSPADALGESLPRPYDSAVGVRRRTSAASQVSATSVVMPAPLPPPTLANSVSSPRRPNKVKKIMGEDDAQRFADVKSAQATAPWYLQPRYGDMEIRLDPVDGTVKAGTLPALVERLTIDAVSLNLEKRYWHAFLTTFRTFATADQVFDLLVEHYQMDHPSGLNTAAEFEEWKEKKQKTTQHKVLTVLTMWLEDHQLLQEDSQVAPRLQEFLSLITSSTTLAVIAKLMRDSLERLTFAAVPAPPAPGLSAMKRRKNVNWKGDISKMDHADIARQLCLIEHRLYAKLRAHDCLMWAKTQMGRNVNTVIGFCATHDKLASWVKVSILNSDGLGKRAATVDFWIKCAEKCRQLNNLSSLFAIVAGLASTVISRLHLTWAHVSRGSHLEPLTKLTEPTANFSAYRNLLASLDGPCVPFVGMYLSDIVHINDQQPDNINVPAPVPQDGSVPAQPQLQINFVKRFKWYDAVSTILKFQQRPYAFVEDTQLLAFCQQQMDSANARDQNWYWARSQDLQHDELAHADIRAGLVAAGF